MACISSLIKRLKASEYLPSSFFGTTPAIRKFGNYKISDGYKHVLNAVADTSYLPESLLDSDKEEELYKYLSIQLDFMILTDLVTNGINNNIYDNNNNNDSSDDDSSGADDNDNNENNNNDEKYDNENEIIPIDIKTHLNEVGIKYKSFVKQPDYQTIHSYIVIYIKENNIKKFERLIIIIDNRSMNIVERKDIINVKKDSAIKNHIKCFNW